MYYAIIANILIFLQNVIIHFTINISMLEFFGTGAHKEFFIGGEWGGH